MFVSTKQNLFTYLSWCAREMIFTSAGSLRSLGFIITKSDLEPYITVLSGAQAKTVVSYQLGDDGITKEFIFGQTLKSYCVLVS